MRFARFAIMAIALSASTAAGAAGIRFIDVPEGPTGSALAGIIWSPCEAPTGRVRIGGRTFPGTEGCPVVGGKLPLIIVSHGRTGWSGGHRDTTTQLANAGFIVAAIDHPIDSSVSKTSRVDDIAYLAERPNDIKRLIDFMLEASPLAANIDRERIGYFGFSRGGYTGLVLIGGEPNQALAKAICGSFPTGTLCPQIRDGKFPTAAFVHDARIKAAVLADPAPAFFFGPDDLKSVSVPVQLWASEQGGRGAVVDDITKIGNALSNAPGVSIVRNAGHYVFLTPCRPERVKSAPEVCADPAGFDRTAFHREFNASLVVFFRQHLAGNR
jgi:predicted dienelactone hydrolase